MRLNVGNKVLLRNDLIDETWYGDTYFRSDMFKGQVVTIDYFADNFADSCHFLIKEDGGHRFYTPRMCIGQVLDDNRLVRF